MNKKSINTNVIKSKILKLNNGLEHIEKYEIYLKNLNDLALIALKDPDKTKLNIELKVSVVKKEKEENNKKDPKKLLENLLNAENPQSFSDIMDDLHNTLDASNKIEVVKDFDITMDKLTNLTFLSMLTLMCNILNKDIDKAYKNIENLNK